MDIDHFRPDDQAWPSGWPGRKLRRQDREIQVRGVQAIII